MINIVWKFQIIMNLDKSVSDELKNIWDQYINSGKEVFDNKGNSFGDIDASRKISIVDLNRYINQFIKGKIPLDQFKTNIDSYNKRNNLWGFPAIKGQMFFNQLTKNNQDSINELTQLLQLTILEPKNLDSALEKLTKLEKFCRKRFDNSTDKRKIAHPESVCYFLSYFWQIQNPDLWPIFYTSQINAYQSLGLWEEKKRSQPEAYQEFYRINEAIRVSLSKYAKTALNNWDIEHALWNYTGNPIQKTESQTTQPIINLIPISENLDKPATTIATNFIYTDYLIPRVAKLIELGGEIDLSSSKKGSIYESMVSEIFSLMGFDVEKLGQGSGREPDAILRHRSENTAFIIDAKAYQNGYKINAQDERAIREYIQHYCPKLIKEGYKKIGFMIVSNSFLEGFDEFINELTWETDIKRFILLTSEALLYLMAYQTKNNLTVDYLINIIISLSSPIRAQQIVEKLDDV